MRKIVILGLLLAAATIIAMSTRAFAPTTFDFGNTASGTGGNSILDRVGGSAFTLPGTGQVLVLSITAEIACNTQSKEMKAAIYDSSYNFIASTEEVLVYSPGGNYVPYWVTFNFASPQPTVTAGSTYVLVAWSELGAKKGSADLYYVAVTAKEMLFQHKVYGTWPDPAVLIPDDGGIQTERACIYATVSPIPGFVVPEVPWGTIAASGSMIIALVAYVTIPRLRARALTKE